LRRLELTASNASSLRIGQDRLIASHDDWVASPLRAKMQELNLSKSCLPSLNKRTSWSDAATSPKGQKRKPGAIVRSEPH